MLDRAYVLLDVKAIVPDARTFSGIASTPEVDRTGDSVDPAGLTFRNPLPLLLHHDQSKPVGTVMLTATPDGLVFDATLPDVDEPGVVKSRIDEAWHSIKARLITGVSIGFRVLDAVLTKSGRHVTRGEIAELSLVTIPANAHATILTVKSLAAPPRQGSTMKQTSAEYVTNLENKRAAVTARMSDIMQASADAGETLDEGADSEYTGLSTQVKAIDRDLVKWRELAALNVAAATPITTPAVVPTKSAFPTVTVKSNTPPGTAFVRLACAKVICYKNGWNPVDYAKRWDDSTPEVALALKAAVNVGTATDAVWAGPLVHPNISTDFLELLRAATILGKIPGLRIVPFNTLIPSQTAGGSYAWVGEGAAKPVTSLGFASVTLTWAKAAGIIAITEELARLSSPSAEALVRNDMVAGIARFLDSQFTDPTIAAVAGVHPASVTNGAPNAAATGNPLADMMSVINYFAVNNVDVSGLTILMSPTNALSLAFRTYYDGSPMFPGISVTGGTYRGINIVTSNTVGNNVIALQPNLILYADDGGVTIDVSREASIQMNSAPDSPPTAATVMVSLWQNNMIGLRAERFINWQVANAHAVYYLTAANWPAPNPPGGLSAQDAPPPANHTTHKGK